MILPAIPARDLTLPGRLGDSGLCPVDPCTLVEHVREHLTWPGGPRPMSAQILHVRWKPRVALSALYALALDDGEPALVTVKRYASDKGRAIAGSYQPDRRAREQSTRLQPYAALSDAGLYLYAFPTDRELIGLPRVLNLRRIGRGLDARGIWPGERVRARHSRATLLRYKPEHRAVVRLDLVTTDACDARREHVLAARVLAPSAAARVVAARRRFEQSRAQLSAPRLIAAEERTGLVYEEWLTGERFAPTDFSHASNAGALLAAVHRPAPASASCEAPRERRELAALFALDAELAARFAHCAVVDPPSAATWVHGDFHPDQFLRSPDGGTALLDWDALHVGHPVEDLAAWVADDLVAHPAHDFAHASRELLSAYASAGGAHAEETVLRAQVATEIVRRAAAALRRIEDGALERARELLLRAQSLADRASRT
ncbi:MAG: phosphotransferase family protein [Planctomycetota bacterium]